MADKKGEPPGSDYFKVKNDWWDALMKYPLPGRQRRCLDFVIRMTYGWQRKKWPIPICEFVSATGILRAHVISSLTILKNKRLINREKIPGKRNMVYTFNKYFIEWEGYESTENGTYRFVKVTENGTFKVPKTVLLGTENGTSSEATPITSKNILKTVKNNTRARQWPPDFKLTKKLIDYAVNKNIDPRKVDAFFENMKNWAESKEAKYKNWEAAFRTRVDLAPQYGRQFLNQSDGWEDV